MKTCLIVEDSHIVRRITHRMVADLGYEVVEVANGQIALMECEKQKFSVILLDWSMPVMDGVEFLKKFRETDITTKVIFCSVEDDPKLIDQAIQFGADGFISKPFDSHKIRIAFDEQGLVD